jgi:hypothetical protein
VRKRVCQVDSLGSILSTEHRHKREKAEKSTNVKAVVTRSGVQDEEWEREGRQG